MTCADVQALAAELALGGVSGAERAAALGHLARCDNCRGLVDELARAADDLLLLAPSTEPPPGFESRVLARIGAAAAASQPVPLRPSRRRRVWVAAAAVAAVAALSTVGVAELRSGGGSGGGTATVAPAPAPAGVRTALVSDDAGRWTCRAVVYGDNPTWLVVSLDRKDGLNAAFSVEAVRAGDDEAVPVGTFTISDGHGSLATMVGLQAQQFEAIRVLDAGGHVRYEATFPQQA
jgi:hypothetical protein